MKDTERFDPTSTVEILNAATLNMRPDEGPPDVIVDGGPENYNPGVNDLVESGRLRRLLALTEVIFSNSMIESWWRVLKHQWLFLNTLDSAASVRKLVEFYVEEHNTRLPHHAFRLELTKYDGTRRGGLFSQPARHGVEVSPQVGPRTTVDPRLARSGRSVQTIGFHDLR